MATQTEQVLADMLTENTGRSMLDSGGAYGRNWERNSLLTVEDFIAQPDATLDRWGCVDLNVFHYLRDRLEYDEDLDAEFGDFAADSDDPWLADAERFAAHKKYGQGYVPRHGDPYGRPQTYNSYNGECLLSQTIQWVEWRDEYGDAHILLQIHGGCDVRGGYTRPRAFTLKTYEQSFGYDMADAEVGCQGSKTPAVIGQTDIDGRIVTQNPVEYHSWRVFGGRVEEQSITGTDAYGERYEDWDNAELPELDSLECGEDEQGRDNGKPLCPVCSAELVVTPPYAD